MKRIAAMVVLLALLACQGALAQNYIVQYPDTEHYHNRHALLLTEAGKLLCDPSDYSEIQRLTPQDVQDNQCLYAARRYGYSLNTDYNSEEVYNNVSLLNAAGKPITDFAFSDFAYDQSTNRIIFKRYNGDERQSGLMEPDGTIIAQWPFQTVIPNDEGGYIGQSLQGSLFYIDADLVIHDTGCTSSYMEDSNGYNDGLLFIYEEQGYCWLDTKGKRIDNRHYDFVYRYHGGWAVVRLPGEDGYAFIDARGNTLPMRYDTILWSEEDKGYLCTGPSFVDFYHADDHMRQTRITVDTPANWSLDTVYHAEGNIADDGTVVSMPRWKGIIGIAVENEGLYCYNTEGEPMFHLKDIPGKDMYYYYFNEWIGVPTTLILGVSQEQDMLIDREGNPITDAYDGLIAPIWRWGTGRFRFAVNSEYGSPEWFGVLDEKGNVLLDAVYENLEVLDLDRYWVRQNNRWGLIDSRGNWLCEISDYMTLLD